MNHVLTVLTSWLPLAAQTSAKQHRVCSVSESWWCSPAITLIRVGVIVVVALAIRFAAHRAITRVVDRTAAGLPVPLKRIGSRARALLEPDSAMLTERRRQRAETIGSVLRSITSFVVFGIAFVMVLKEVGFDIAPVLTGAGIVGVAVGFGAQNLVKDFISGMFMILEDQYGVGDLVDAGPATGTVEAVGLRTTRLRDADGTVWHIRNGEIARIGNKSQGWSRVTLDVPVPRTSDVDAVERTLREVAAGVRNDPDYAADVLADGEVWGVESFDKDNVTLRLSLRTQPQRHAEVARELRTRAYDALRSLPAPDQA